MGSTTVSAGEAKLRSSRAAAAKSAIRESIDRLIGWLEKNDYQGYDTFDGLSARYLRPLTFENPVLRTVLQQGVRRFPVNLRPILMIKRERSSKGMGFLARGFMRLYKATGDPAWSDKAKASLQWLMEHKSIGYHGACWGNHFDYQSRNSFVPKGVPSVVWTSLIGHAFLDAYDYLRIGSYLEVADSACRHILCDLSTYDEDDACCISYFPGQDIQIHNASTLGASLLARTYSYTGEKAYLDLAERAIRYTARHQRSDGSWYYGERRILNWIDNFHTGYVLDCFKHYLSGTGDTSFEEKMMTGYAYWKETFFLEDGTPRYYNNRTLPLDIQCSSQAIDTLMFFSDRDPDALPLATKVAKWTIGNMQDATGYFYYRRYSSWLVNKTPTIHWGQATMLCALAGLYVQLLPMD